MSARRDPKVASLIDFAEPDEDHTRMVLAPDLMLGFVNRPFLELAARHLDEVLADETVSTADLKGALNRASGGTWGVEYHCAFTPREFLEALKTAIETHLRRPS